MAAVPTRPRASTLPAKKPQTLPVKHQHYPYGDDDLDQTQSSTNSIPPSSRPAARASNATPNQSHGQGSSTTPNRPSGTAGHESHTRPPAPAHVPTKGASRAASPILTAPPRPSASESSRSNREPSQRPPSRMDSGDSNVQRTRTPPPNGPRHTPVPSRSSTPGAAAPGPIQVPQRRPPSQSTEPADRDEHPPPQQQVAPARPPKATVDNTSVKPVKEQRGTIERQNAEAQEQAQPPRKAREDPPHRSSEPQKTNSAESSSGPSAGQPAPASANSIDDQRDQQQHQQEQKPHPQAAQDHKPSDQHQKSEPPPPAPTEQSHYGSLPEALTYVSVVLKPASAHSAEAPKLFRLTLRGDCGQIAVQSLKEALADFSGIPVDRQRLIKDGVTLGNSQLGAEFGLRAGTVLYLDRMFSTETPSAGNSAAPRSEPLPSSTQATEPTQPTEGKPASDERTAGNVPKGSTSVEEKNQPVIAPSTAPPNAQQQQQQQQQPKHGVVSVNGRTDSDRQGVLTLTDGKQTATTEEFEFKLSMEQQLEELKAIELSLGRLKEALNVRRRLFSRAQHEREVRLAKEEQAKREELRQLRAMRSRVVYETAAVPYRSGAPQERKGRGFRPISPVLATGHHPVAVQYRGEQPQYYVFEEDEGEGDYATNPEGAEDEDYAASDPYGYDGGGAYAHYQDPYQTFLHSDPHAQGVELQGMESQPQAQVIGGRTAKPRMALSPHHADTVRYASRAPSKSSSAPPLPVDPSWSAPRPSASASTYRGKSNGFQRGVSQSTGNTFVVGEEITDDLLVDLSQDNLPVPVSSGRGGAGGGHMLLQPQPRYSSNNTPVQYQSSRGLGQWEQRNVTNSPTRHLGHHPNQHGTGAHGGVALTSPYRD